MIIFMNNKSTKFVKLHRVLKYLFIKEKWSFFTASRCSDRLLANNISILSFH